MTYGNYNVGGAGNYDHSGYQSNETSAGEGGRKEYMSLNVESIQVSLSRSRQLGSKASALQFSTICDIGSANFKYDMRRLVEILDFPKAWYRKAIIRRILLGEESLLHPLKQHTSQCSDPEGSTLENYSEESEGEASGSSEHGRKPTPQETGDAAFSSASPAIDAHSKLPPNIRVNTPDCSDFKPPDKTPHQPPHINRLISTSTPLANGEHPKNLIKSKVPLKPPETAHEGVSHALSVGSSGSGGTGSSHPSVQQQLSNVPTSWETLVLLAINLKKLDIQMNMSNAMGNTVWTTTNLRTDGRISLGSNGRKDLIISAGFEESDLEAKGGIVGGVIDISKVETTITISENPMPSAEKSTGNLTSLESGPIMNLKQFLPQHGVRLKLDALETRVDFMGSSILMARLSSLGATVTDEWKLDDGFLSVTRKPSSPDEFAMTRRRAHIFLNSELSWDKLHVMITRSTTPDLIRLTRRLNDFFSHQFQSGKKVWESIGPGYPEMRGRRQSRPRSTTNGSEEGYLTGTGTKSTTSSTTSAARHHRHWQRPLSTIFNSNVLSCVSSPFPKQGTILGGTMRLQGTDLALACFSGINFRSNKWAVFYLSEPTIIFTTEAQFVRGDPGVIYATDQMDTSIVQELRVNLGNDLSEKQRATIYRFSREKQNAPTHASTLREWFNYTFATLPEMDTFPHRARERSESVSSLDKRRKVEYKHNAVDIFALPCMECRLRTNHLQTYSLPSAVDEVGEKAVVNCSFYTSFENHIQVRMDAELFFFLHELVQNYMHECDKATGGSSSSTNRSSAFSSDVISTRKLSKEKKGEKTENESTSKNENDSEKREAGDEPKKDPKDTEENAVPSTSEDWREFVCQAWHLNPTLSFLTAGVWAEPIEPSVGVDYVLNKLGFKNANTTIPKWTQRGVMDPMDKILSVMMRRFILALREKEESESTDKK
jgi:hypothetical protein